MSVQWSQLPAYFIGEFVGAVAGAFAYLALATEPPGHHRPGPVVPRHRGGPGMKKLINAPDDVVVEALRGIAAAHPSLAVDVENKVITRAGGPTAGKVGLVSGGGSGHEPLHGGFVGFGMLDAACPGEVFTSPVPDQMLLATKAVDGGAGVLHIVKNYTGDVLNFQMAAELAVRREHRGRLGRRQRRRRRAGQPLHGRAPRHRRDGLRREDRRRARRAAQGAQVGRRRRARGQRAVPVVRRRAHRVHHAGVRAARLRPARRRDRARRRHPRRARPRARPDARRPRRSSTSRWPRSTTTCRSRASSP